jgi:hypothetical protein
MKLHLLVYDENLKHFESNECLGKECELCNRLHHLQYCCYVV